MKARTEQAVETGLVITMGAILFLFTALTLLVG
jgi:hypothetical protein